MSALVAWREELRRLIPRGFLRRDQGDGLFASDYPRHGEETPVSDALRRAGYTVDLRGSLAHVDGSVDKYRALAGSLRDAEPPPTEESFWLRSLALHLQRTGAEPCPENLYLIRLTLKALDAGDLPGLERLLPPAVAEAQQKHIPLPKAAGQLIIYAIENPKGAH